MAKHHRHSHKKDEPKPELRKFVVPITLIILFVYAAHWAVRISGPANLAAGIVIVTAAALFWIFHPRKRP